MTFKINQEIAACGGKLLKMSHASRSTCTTMDVNVYLPVQYYKGNVRKIPTVYYLSGLTCTPNNASEKAFWQIQADKFGFVIVFPDTSPRGDGVPEDPEASWDFGIGAGFYVNATQEPYKKNYQMYDYVHDELPRALQEYFEAKRHDAVDFVDNVSITGHSMGGFGALSGYLKTYAQHRYKACSAFAPIVNPSKVGWGQRAFTGYLGTAQNKWAQYDPCELIKQAKHRAGDNILIHVGSQDPFLTKHLKPELLQEAIESTDWEGHVDIKIVDGFDHSYYFISSFVPEHAEFHAKRLGLL